MKPSATSAQAVSQPAPRICCFLTASGRSRRFGENKLLYPFHGQPMIQYAIDAVRVPEIQQILIVTVHEEVRKLAEAQGISCLLHDLPRKDQAIALGLQHMRSAALCSFEKNNKGKTQTKAQDLQMFSAVPPQRDSAAQLQPGSQPQATDSLPWDGYLFCPCDQPCLTAATICGMCRAFAADPEHILRLHDGKRPGAPVLFPARFHEELLHLPEDQGGSALIRKYPELVRNYIVADPRELIDIDTKDSLNLL